jgi:hypothetical protein
MEFSIVPVIESFDSLSCSQWSVNALSEVAYFVPSSWKDHSENEQPAIRGTS